MVKSVAPARVMPAPLGVTRELWMCEFRGTAGLGTEAGRHFLSPCPGLTGAHAGSPWSGRGRRSGLFQVGYGAHA